MRSPAILLRLAAAALATLPAAAQVPAPGPAAAPEITLERIMADPDWIGNPPEDPYWADDGGSVYYFRKRPGEEVRDLVQMDLLGNTLRVYDLGERGGADAPGERSRDGRRKVWTREGDLFVKDLHSGTVRQLTRTAAAETRPGFTASGDGVLFRRGDALFVRDLASGLESQLAELRLEEDPDAEEDEEESYLEDQQRRLIEYVRETEEEEREERQRERSARRTDPTRLSPPFYLGEDVEIRQAAASPAGRWLLLALGEKGEEGGRKGTMPVYVTASGYVETREVRPRVGTGERAGERLLLLDLESGASHPLVTDGLPGILEDPLAELRAAAAERREREEGEAEAGEIEEEDLEPEDLLRPREEEVLEAEAMGTGAEAGEGDGGEVDGGEGDGGEEEPRARPVSFRRVEWSDDGRRVALMAHSLDNKDRWIVTVDLEAAELVPVHRLHDPAWINWAFNDLGWLAGGDRLWYLSEESGSSQLYLADLAHPAAAAPAAGAGGPAADPAAGGGEEAADAPEAPPATAPDAGAPEGRSFAGAHRRLTPGDGVVSGVQATRDGAYLYYRANAGHPGVYEIWRVEVASGENRRLTDLGGVNEAVLSPDETRLLITHSETVRPPELYVQAAEPEAAARRLTHSTTREFDAVAWTEPEIVAVPAGDGGPPIHSRLYLPAEAADAPPGSLPAVFFIHGAGYLQNAHAGWSGYFREFMFHSLLTRRGYAVLDMDYRASAGYGRDWRTAIYRHMGGPELEDLEDGVAWLTAHHPVDRERIGVYGGSYGGFLTLMALFTRPELFACGAALRPVTDWAHYNHPYTSNILNTPGVDPEAYERSSPIELADGLARPLLMCAPMLDDNVFFQDTVRLAQRLIELGKEDWEVAIFPVEPHGFRQPSSWLNEYRRILDLFEENLKPRECGGG